MPVGHPGSPQVEVMLRELGELWEDLQRKHQENGAVLQEIDKVRGGWAGVGAGAWPHRKQLAGDRQARPVPAGMGSAVLALTSPAGITACALLQLCHPSCQCPGYLKWGGRVAPASPG